MYRSDHGVPLPAPKISRKQIEQGIARARYLRSKAYADFFSTVNRKIAALGAATRRPKLSPMEPSST